MGVGQEMLVAKALKRTSAIMNPIIEPTMPMIIGLIPNVPVILKKANIAMNIPAGSIPTTVQAVLLALAIEETHLESGDCAKDSEKRKLPDDNVIITRSSVSFTLICCKCL